MSLETIDKESNPPFPTRGDGDFWGGLFRLADPKITLASMSSIFLGACLVAVDGDLHWGWLGLTVLGFFAVEVAKNASGDIFDFDSGADLAVSPEDRTDFSGGKRVLVDSLLDRRQTWGIAIVFYLIALLAGAAIVFFREPRALMIGLVGLLLAWLYNGPPGRLCYRGLGELDVMICYGPLICASTYLIQLGTITRDVVLLSLPLGVLIAAFLWINEFPDFEGDRKVGKRNLVVRLGRRNASRVLPLIQAVAFLFVALLPLLGISRGVWLGMIAVPLALWVSYQTLRDPERCYRDRPVQATSLLVFLLLSSGMGIGLLLSGSADSL